jgi:hypothetical protein
MSSAAAKLLSDFEALEAREKQEFVQALVFQLPRWDSGELEDEVAAFAGDQMAAILGEEERAS